MKKTVRKKRKVKKEKGEKKMKTGGTNTDTRKKSQGKNLNKQQIEFLKFDRIVNKAYSDIKNQLDILEDTLF
tara:strand:- start:114 stop:329 length:216 start_codon:yes stop_codon:yes gene_type:complete